MSLLLLHMERGQLWRFGNLWRFSRHNQLEGDPKMDQELTGGSINLILAGNNLGSPRRSWKALLGRRTWNTQLNLLLPQPDPVQVEDNGWIDIMVNLVILNRMRCSNDMWKHCNGHMTTH